MRLIEKNCGTYWSAGELRLLNKLARSGMQPPDIARQLLRSVGGVKQRLAILRTAELFRSGNDSDTLVSTRKDPRFNFGEGTITKDMIINPKYKSKVKIGKS